MTIQKGDVIWVDLGQPKGSVQSGCRPAVVFTSAVACRYASVITVIPLTTARKKIPVQVELNVRDKNSVALTEQITTISLQQILGEPIARVPKKDLKKLNIAVKKQLAIDRKE